MTKPTAGPALRPRALRLDARSVARGRSRIGEVGVPAALLLIALMLRLTNYVPQGWAPDTYEQMRATHRLVSGEFPLSRIYPPGIALSLAPAFLFLPHTIETMHLVNVAAAVALTAVLYVRTIRATGDRLAASLLAFAVVVAPQFVVSSRDGLFDTIATAWIVSAIMCAPLLRGRGLASFALYGVMLSIAINVRATNAAFLPAAIIYWCGERRVPVRPTALIQAIFSPGLMTAAATMASLSALYAWIGGWTGHAASAAPVSFGAYGEHIGLYVAVEFGGVPIVAAALLPLAIAGGFELWQRNRPLVLAAIYMIAVWPIVHSPIIFSSARYMLPAYVFVLFLAAHGTAAAMRAARSLRWSPARANRIVAVGVVLLVGVYYSATSVVIVRDWPERAGRTDEGAFIELRPVVAGLPAGSLLVSPAARGVSQSNTSLEYLDLIDYSLDRGNGPDSVEHVMGMVQSALDAGTPVYYLHSRVEATGDTFTQSGPGYEPYFAGVAQRFTVRVRYAATIRHYTLYEVTASDTPTPARARAW